MSVVLINSLEVEINIRTGAQDLGQVPIVAFSNTMLVKMQMKY